MNKFVLLFIFCCCTLTVVQCTSYASGLPADDATADEQLQYASTYEHMAEWVRLCTPTRGSLFEFAEFPATTNYSALDDNADMGFAIPCRFAHNWRRHFTHPVVTWTIRNRIRDSDSPCYTRGKPADVEKNIGVTDVFPSSNETLDATHNDGHLLRRVYPEIESVSTYYERNFSNSGDLVGLFAPGAAAAVEAPHLY